MEKGAIQRTVRSENNFISNLILVPPKKDNTLRPVINLRKLNKFIEYKHFKQDNLSFAFDLLQKNDFCCSIDMKDAYFSIEIHPDFRKYLCFFFWNNESYQFKKLPFGITSAPRVFTKVLKPVYTLFRSNGIRCCYYIYDSLVMNQYQKTCLKRALVMSNQLEDLDFTINTKKSVFEPTQRIVFFGLILDTVQFKVFLTDEKLEKLISLNIIFPSYRPATNKQYEHCWKRWTFWCREQQIDVIKYLTFLIQSKVSYSVVVNTHKSMLTQTLAFFGVLTTPCFCLNL